MTHSFPSRPRHPVAGARRVPWRVSTLLIALWLAACESPVAPAACGPLSAVTVNVGETSSVAACFNDANNDVLTYTASSSNPAVATASISGASITVAGVAPGNTTVTVTASDPGGLQGQSSFAVTVPNRAPQPRGTIPNVTVRVDGTARVEASRYFSEPDGEPLTYAAGSSDADVASVSVSGSTVTVTARATGRATITVTASDPGGLSANQSFRLTVSNRPPAAVGAIGAQTIEVGRSVTIDVARSFRDPDGDALTYSATSSSSSVARASVSGSTVTITGASAGRATVTVTARDPGGLTATQRISVTVGGSGGADLVVSLSKSSATVAPGGSVTYDVTVRNQGTARSAATRARVFQSDDPTITTSDRELDSAPIRSLAPSEEATGTNRITIPAGARDGSKFYVGDCVDAVAGESNTDNNCSSAFTITVGRGGGSDGADLVVTVSESSATVAPGGSFSYEATIRNQGDAVAAATQVRVFASTDATISTSDRQVGEPRRVPSLDPSQAAKGTESITVSEGAPPGTVYFGNCVDAVAGESNTNNNCSSAIRVTIQTGGGGGSDTTYTTGQTIETLPASGCWLVIPSGGSYQCSQSEGVVRITLNNASSFFVHNNIRYSCRSSGGCQIVGRQVTRGSIGASRQSSSSMIAEPQWDRLLQATGAEGAVIRLRPDDDSPADRYEVDAVLWIRPGGGGE